MFYAEQAEKYVISAIVKDNTLFNKIKTILNVDDFSPLHRAIYSVIVEQLNSNGFIDKPVLIDLTKKQVNASVIDNICSNLSMESFEFHVNQLLFERDRRNIEMYCKKIHKQIKATTSPLEFKTNIQTEIQKLINSITTETNTIKNINSSENIKAALNKIEVSIMNQGAVGVPTGFTSLDEILLGLQDGDLIIIAARPGMGKTTFAYNIAENIVMQKKRGMMFSLEMSVEQLTFRSLARLASINQTSLQKGEFSEVELEKLTFAIEELNKLDIVIDEEAELDIDKLCLRARREHLEKPLSFVLVDCLQLVTTTEKYFNKSLEIGVISSKLNKLAKELNIPVIVLSGLNRKLEKRYVQRPILSDLYGSGAIEQYADVIMFIYLDEIYNALSQNKGIAEIIISKNRNGILGTVHLSFKGEYASFENI